MSDLENPSRADDILLKAELAAKTPITASSLDADVIVIGAGPAGLMAAETAARHGARVIVFDRMASPARKFLLAGRGGLNLTHSENLDRFLQRYGEGHDAIARIVRSFTPEHMVAWAHGLGQPTFVGSSGRIFPKAMKASPLLRAWLQRLTELGVVLKLRHTWVGLTDQSMPLIRGPDGGTCEQRCGAVILALGGASWPKLGSDGSWVAPLSTTGFDVAALQPSNCGVTIAWSDLFATKFAGRPLKRIALRVGRETARGEAMITARGLEGGAVYALSRPIRKALSETGEALLTIDLKPDMVAADVAARIRTTRGRRSLSNHLRKVLALDPQAIGLLHEMPFPQGEPELDTVAIADRIKAMPLKISGLAGLDRAISTAGGVTLAQLTPGLMATHRPGVFVVGEMLDWDAPTGGYLLQACFATGVVAGTSAAEWVAANIVGVDGTTRGGPTTIAAQSGW